MSLIAKPVLLDKYWIVTDGDRKVGNVLVDGNGVSVSINGKNRTYIDTNELKKDIQLTFASRPVSSPSVTFLYSEFPVDGPAFNSVIDVKRKIRLFTKAPRGKCYHAAGWYVVRQNSAVTVALCPKDMLLHRYPYKGPFRTEEEARAVFDSAINT